MGVVPSTYFSYRVRVMFKFSLYPLARWATAHRLSTLAWLVAVAPLLTPGWVYAHGFPPPSLKGVSVPVTPGLLDGDQPIVVDKNAAIRLGKAFFWDSAVGSDGVACATCHFHAGADGRIQNQLAPGTFHAGSPTANTFERTASGAAGGPNYALKRRDFPFYQFADPSDNTSAILYATDDVASSSGVSLGVFQASAPSGTVRDDCRTKPDAMFHSGALNTRRVEPRNTPTVINAAFNFRNFWDGRANNIFNGVSPFGPRDPNAGVWVLQANGQVKKQPLRLENASLASQAVAPGVNDIEMSCIRRALNDVGRKLAPRRPLEFQVIHRQDSVLGGQYRDASGKGLKTTYEELIKTAFAPRYWAGTGGFGRSVQGGPPYNQMEANFPMFFGLALQLYQETLVSDDTPYDTPANDAGVPSGLNEQQARGLQVFLDAHCHLCHKGPTFSAAAHPAVAALPGTSGGLLLLNRKTLKGASTGVGVNFALLDEGFTNTSVTPTAYDPGIGGNDPFGNPLSFTAQYVSVLLGQAQSMVDPLNVQACLFEVPFVQGYTSTELIPDPFGNSLCGVRKSYAKVPSPAVFQAELDKPHQGRAVAAVQGAFKIPTLRNVELTGPYMHNGGMKNLEEVVEFYNRGGNLDNAHHFSTVVFSQGFTDEQKADLVAFLKSLTDERVRWEKAPFDHPQLFVPHGHNRGASALNPLQASDRFIQVPAVGREGRTVTQGPVQPFETLLKP